MVKNKQHSLFTRRSFLSSSLALSTVLILDLESLLANNQLSANTSKALGFPHFPNRLFAFVWRNWSLVPTARMAKVLSCSEESIHEIGKAMGLVTLPIISKDQWSRSYISIIRRNWHILPNEQLIDLLGWTKDQYEFVLQEDDFLYIKLGSFKPDCDYLRFEPLAKSEQITRIQQVINEEFPNGLGGTEREEPLFNFVKELSSFPEDTDIVTKSGFTPLFGYGYFMLFGDPLLDTEVDPFPEGYLYRMANAGQDGTWLHIVLSKITPFHWDLSLSTDWEKRLENLKKLSARCAKYNIGIYLYLNEPRSLPLSFFDKYPELKGAVDGDHASLCTSHPDVQRYLVDSIAMIVEAVPSLAGFLSITASENRTNCWSHGQGATCRRCESRGAAEVIAELNNLYDQGIKKGIDAYRKKNLFKEKAAPLLIVWDWGWRDGWAENIIPKLQTNSSFISVSEWDLPIERGGIKGKVGEYSISSIGPGPRAKKHWSIAKKYGIAILAKIQTANTWELGAVPYIPAVENVAQHVFNLREEGIDGFMLGWTLGGYPSSPNLEVVAELGRNKTAKPLDAMRIVAERRYGIAGEAVVSAWIGFSKAFKEFPYHRGVLYKAPVQVGAANLLWPSNTGYKSTMVGIPYDDLKSWRSVYPEDTFIAQFYKVAEGFDGSLSTLKMETKGLELTEEQRKALFQELQVAETVFIHYRSVANQSSFIKLRNHIEKRDLNVNKTETIARIEAILKDEIDLAKRMFYLQKTDSRLGFEASNHYFYIPSDLIEKVFNCRYLLDVWVKKLKES